MLRLSGVSTIIRTPGAEPWSKFSIEWLLTKVSAEIYHIIETGQVGILE